MLVHDYQELDFVKVDDVPAVVEQATESVFEALSDETLQVEKELNENVPDSKIEESKPESKEKKGD